mgnify:CR=1 FL=1
MPSNPLNKRTRGWYTVAVDTVRGAVIIASFAALALAGYSLYRQWGQKALEQEVGTSKTDIRDINRKEGQLNVLEKKKKNIF